MTAFTYIPEPPLSEFVEMFWYFEDCATAHPRERLMPTGTTELVINLGPDFLDRARHSRNPREPSPQRHPPAPRVPDTEKTPAESPGRESCRPDTIQTVHSTEGTRFPRAILAGARSRPMEIPSGRISSVIGIHFRPGGAFPFLGMPAREVQDHTLPLEAIWGRSALELEERLLHAHDAAARFRLLEAALRARACSPLERHPAVGFALRAFQGTPHLVSVADVTDRVGLSSRRLGQLFADEVGLAPKLFSRIQRFQRALRAIRRGSSPDWAELALSCGYYDQAHFNHDFREFSGMRPTAYLRHQSEHVNHVPLPE
jgi:AraC-like DNA-binding protein